ncbi:Nn.00g089560.m01.CDS01 [Neocucurbitaria sp. VM-36]
MDYSYVPLQGTDSVRLLQLKPGYSSDPLEAHLATYRLAEQCSYDALSYVWGEPDLTEKLDIGDRVLTLSRNLHTILLQLRLPDKVRTLWIDAICINQQDCFEKGQQIALMGDIYQQADTVLCWLGQLSTHRLWALKFLQKLAEDAPEYSKLEKDVGAYWTVTSVDYLLLPGVDENLIVAAAVEAHVEAIYESDWFTRLWIVQEVTLASNPMIVCDTFSLTWDEFEIATRLISACLKRASSPPKALLSISDAYTLIHHRAKHSLHKRPITAPQICIEADPPWSLGCVAWNMRERDCKDDRDRVYAVLSLAVNGNGLKIWVPEPFVPDYAQPIEWVYYQYWRRYGGCTSVFYAGLSRRRDQSESKRYRDKNEDVSKWSSHDYLPSWVPELRSSNTNEWKPIFCSDYGTSTPFQRKVHHFTNGPRVLMIRGHRFDSVVRIFGMNRCTKPCEDIENFVDLRTIVKSFLSLKSKYEPYPSGQPWVEALGSALILDKPYNTDHAFQKQLDALKFNIRLFDDEVQNIWELYQKLLLSDNGAVWKKLRRVVRTAMKSRRTFEFRPFMELDRDGQIVWLLHGYIGTVLEAHRLFITERGYMGLAPPDVMVGDVVVAFGGPSVPFIVRDVTTHAVDQLSSNAAQCSLVLGGTGRNLSQLLGPCYLQGIMKAELIDEERYKREFEWEPVKKAFIPRVPKPNLYLI